MGYRACLGILRLAKTYSGSEREFVRLADGREFWELDYGLNSEVAH